MEKGGREEKLTHRIKTVNTFRQGALGKKTVTTFKHILFLHRLVIPAVFASDVLIWKRLICTHTHFHFSCSSILHHTEYVVNKRCRIAESANESL